MKHRAIGFLTVVAAMLASAYGSGTVQAAERDSQQLKVDTILARHSGSVQIGKGTIGWRNGIILKVEGGLDDCDTGYFCLWQNIDWKGAILELPERVCDSNQPVNLNSYAFNNIASGWASWSNLYMDVWDGEHASGSKLWVMLPGTYSARLGSDLNDRASSTTCRR